MRVRFADDYNFRARAEVFELRRNYVKQTPQLLYGSYEPYAKVFGAIVSRKPWWGIKGRSVWGPGKRSIEGAAEESRFLSNPYLLVGADPASAEIWKPEAITDQELDKPDFPYAWHIKSLTYWPRKSYATAVYDVTAWLNGVVVLQDKMKEQVVVPGFSLVAYNARDFGFNYIWLEEKESNNIENTAHPTEPTQITQMIHCGGTCHYPGGCNNMSPSIPSIDRIKYNGLPAKAVIKLWREKPSKADQPADMNFTIELE